MSSRQAANSVQGMVKNKNPFPGLFVSHGGPTFMYKDDDFGNPAAWECIRKLGTQIKQQWKPDYIVVVSAHWQSGGSKKVDIAVPPGSSVGKSKENPLIYDFYGFPDYMYKEEFHTKNSGVVAEQIRQELENDGFTSEITERGIDHGVWVPLKVAFLDYNTRTKQPDVKGLDLPDTELIQVSLTGNEKDFQTHYNLGKVLSKFRDNLVWDEHQQKYLKGLVICSGMSVHNLKDIGSFRLPGHVMPYVKPFNDLLNKSIIGSSSILDSLVKLQTENKTLLYKAHPTLEHFVPVVVASGLIDGTGESVTELYNDEQASLGWGMYRFGPDYSA